MSGSVSAPRPDAPRVGWGTVLLFAIVCGGLGEAFELLRIHVGGVAPLAWPIRGALWLAYGLLAGALLVGARLVLRRGALAVAATLAAALLIVPWLNFAYLPRAGSAVSLVGSVGGGAGARPPRATAAARAAARVDRIAGRHRRRQPARHHAHAGRAAGADGQARPAVQRRRRAHRHAARRSSRRLRVRQADQPGVRRARARSDAVRRRHRAGAVDETVGGVADDRPLRAPPRRRLEPRCAGR